MKLKIIESDCYALIIIDMASYINHAKQGKQLCKCELCQRFEEKYLDQLGQFKYIDWNKHDKQQ